MPSLPPNALGVPLVRQETAFSCGPAALLAILRYWGVDEGASEEDLYGELGTTEANGTEMPRLAQAAEARGLDAVASAGACSLDDLAAALAHGATAILNVQAWGDDLDGTDEGHYVVLIGMDAENVYAMDPSIDGAYGVMSRADLLDRWKDVAGEGEVPIECGAVVVFGDEAVGAVDLDGDEEAEEIR